MQRAVSDLIPGRINLESFKNSSGVILSSIGSVTAIPGNLDVYVAEAEVRNEGKTLFTNWPVYTEFGILDAEGQTQPWVVG